MMLTMQGHYAQVLFIDKRQKFRVAEDREFVHERTHGAPAQNKTFGVLVLLVLLVLLPMQICPRPCSTVYTYMYRSHPLQILGDMWTPDKTTGRTALSGAGESWLAAKLCH